MELDIYHLSATSLLPPLFIFFVLLGFSLSWQKLQWERELGMKLGAAGDFPSKQPLIFIVVIKPNHGKRQHAGTLCFPQPREPRQAVCVCWRVALVLVHHLLTRYSSASCLDQWLEAKKEAFEEVHRRIKVGSQCLRKIKTWNLGALLNSSAFSWLSKQELQGFRWGKKIFVLLKLSKNSPMSRRQTQPPGDGFESACCCQQRVLQSRCAELSPPLQSRAVLETRRSPLHVLGTRAVTISLYGRYLQRSLPCSPANLVFSNSRRAPVSCEQGKEALAALYHRRNVKILFPHPRLQNFPANALPFFSLCLIFFPFTQFLPASFHSCLSSVFQLLLLFQFSLSSIPISPAHCISFLFFLLPVYFPPLSSPTLSASAPRLFLSFQCFPLFYTLIPPLAPSP